MNSGGLNYTYAVRGAFQGQLHKYQHVKIDISNSNIALHSIVIFALSLELLAKMKKRAIRSKNSYFSYVVDSFSLFSPFFVSLPLLFTQSFVLKSESLTLLFTKEQPWAIAQVALLKWGNRSFAQKTEEWTPNPENYTEQSKQLFKNNFNMIFAY